MSETHDDTTDAESIDTGSPITALRSLEEPVPETFMDRLNRRIQRRLLVADMSRLTWSGPIRIVLEILSQIFKIGANEPGEQKE